ncbi:MAG: LPS export ABC transporter permease LptG [Pseudomonadota bacterium]|nr:LPS export ABC transporter permease LptG [Pseudomonadota bacterium]
MRTVRRLFYADIVTSVAFVATAFLSLWYFIDFIDQLADVGQGNYTVLHAAAYTLLLVPGHFYEVSPIAVLIGTIYSLARMAQASEYTILRTGGLGPSRALRLLAMLGLLFAAFTFVVGDYLAPFCERQAANLQAMFKGGLKFAGSGAWLKDRATLPDGSRRSYSINVGSAGPRSQLREIRIFEFDAEGRLLRGIKAAAAQIETDQSWTLKDVTVTRWVDTGDPTTAEAREEHLAALPFQTHLSAAAVAAADSSISTMSTIELARYIGHLSENEQAAQSYQIQFWKRALYPFACVVMIGLALPFAYMHARAGGVSLKAFGGIMLGISFVLLNNVAGYLGLLRNWTPWMVSAAPSALYLLLSFAAFSWLVRYR